MEWVEGVTFEKVLEMKVKEAEEEPEKFSRLLLKIFYQLIIALDEMYYWKVFHRDLKPSNIMICFKKEKYFELMVLQNFTCLDSETDFDVQIIDFGYGK